jgi:glycerol kinase
MLATVGAGIHPDLEAASAAMRGEVTNFEPAMSGAERDRRLEGWRDALSRL